MFNLKVNKDIQELTRKEQQRHCGTTLILTSSRKIRITATATATPVDVKECAAPYGWSQN